MRTSKGDLFRAFNSKGISHHYLCLADLKADRWAGKLYSRAKRQLQVRCAQTRASELERLEGGDQP